MKNLILLIFVFSALNLAGQEIYNMDLVAQLQMEPLTSANDVWGYVDKDSIEYAIVGTTDDTRIYSLEDPSVPELVLRIPGTNTIWRDMKSYGDYVYSVTDNTSDGITIINMANPKVSIPHSIYHPVMERNGVLDTMVNAHNLYIDENGILYTCGTNLLDGAPIFLDLNVDPMAPPVIGWVDGNIYSHDIYVRGDTLYASEIYLGMFSVYDISDKRNAIYLGGAQTSFEFTHNAWLSDNGKYLFTTDEKPNANVDAYDISDLNDIQRLNTIRPEAGGGDIIPHNTHFLNNYLITSWYGEGVVITDVTDPSNMVTVGQYDTNPEKTDGSRGCWGAYPYLPSGLILGTDRDNGLFVFSPDYQRAAYLEGCITDELTGEGINGVELQFLGTDINTSTGIDGSIKAGLGSSGTYRVALSKNGYAPKEVTVEMVQGEVAILKVTLLPAEERNLNIKVVDAVTGESIPQAQLFIDSPGRFIVSTDSTGTYTAIIRDGIYDITVGAWGYFHKVTNELITTADDIVISLDRGYQDDYYFDLEWTAESSSNVAGSLIRNSVISDIDVGYDLGGNAYELFALDTSRTTLTSPVMDLTIYEEPEIQLAVNKPQNATSLKLFLVTPDQEVLLAETVGVSRWEWFPLPITGLLDSYEEVYFRFEGGGSEFSSFTALVDAFIVVETKVSSTEDTAEEAYHIYPNPTSELLYVDVPLGTSMDRILMHDVDGRQVLRAEVNGAQTVCDLGGLRSGLYIVSLWNDDQLLSSRKIIKE